MFAPQILEGLFSPRAFALTFPSAWNTLPLVLTAASSVILPQLHSLAETFSDPPIPVCHHFGYELLSLKEEFYLSLPQSIVPEDCPKQTF